MKLKHGLPRLAPPPPPPDNGSVSIHIQREGEVEGNMEVEASQVEVVLPWLAGPC